MTSNINLIPVKVSQKEFLKAFFKSDDSKVYLRAFAEKGRTKTLPSKSFDFRINELDKKLNELKMHNETNMCISFVVNGGGHSDKRVIESGSCTAQFMEMDGFDQDIQISLINSFPLTPSIIVKTRKSLHTYWLLEDGDIKRFRNIQGSLADLFCSDPGIKNESRVMRMPGFEHRKQDPVKVEVIHFKPGLRYSQDQIIEAVGQMDFKSLVKASNLSEEKKAETLKRYDDLKNKKIDSKSSGESPSMKGSDQEITSHRVNTLVSKIAIFNNEGLSDEAIKAALTAINETQCKPPLERARLEREVFPAVDRWHDEKKPVKVAGENEDILERIKMLKPEMNYKWNDMGNGSLFAEVFKENVRWNVSAKEWYFYNGKVWKIDQNGMIASKCAKILYKKLLIYATSEIKDERIQSDYVKHVIKLGTLRNRKTMMEDARDIYCISEKDLDSDLYLLNLQNGVYDLKNFVLLDHSPNYLLSKICYASYDPGAKGEAWIKFINEVMEGDKDKVDYLQKILGYSLTGDTREETCYILYGKSTRNGKSTLVETISYMLGESEGYALNMRPETLALKHNNDSRQASSDIARLKDCRFLNASEPPKRMLLDVGLLKTMLGRDIITARYLHQNEFQFRPYFKLFINTNYLPKINDDTLFSSGRVNVITFDRHFSEKEQDKELKNLLKKPENISGVLNWCIDGLRNYYQEGGASAPDPIKKATELYREESDKIGTFLNECFESSRYENTRGSTAYEMYREWCIDNGYGVENKTSFFDDLRRRGFLQDHGTVDRITQRNVLVGFKVIKESYYP